MVIPFMACFYWHPHSHCIRRAARGPASTRPLVLPDCVVHPHANVISCLSAEPSGTHREQRRITTSYSMLDKSQE